MTDGMTARMGGLELARVLVVEDDPAARLTLQTVLEAGGYRVDSASSVAEAHGKLDDAEYELVLSEMQMESADVEMSVLAHARSMDYEPATALFTTYLNLRGSAAPAGAEMLVEPEDLPALLGGVAHLISARAARMVARLLRR